MDDEWVGYCGRGFLAQAWRWIAFLTHVCLLALWTHSCNKKVLFIVKHIVLRLMQKGHRVEASLGYWDT